ncbi:MAG: c-di-GMP phosphodiesterase class II [Chloroflexi bacterium]|nr:MAG: c-di-GMP phosphodiesterase class II [Chloroflexota bacterium]
MSDYLAQHSGRDAAAALSASLPELVAALSIGLDAAEGQDPGHAARVAYVATRIADHLALGEEVRRSAFYAGILHDIGVPLAAARAGLQPVVDEDVVFGPAMDQAGDGHAPRLTLDQRTQATMLQAAHLRAGSDFLEQPWFPQDISEAVAASHENWAGDGAPGERQGEEIPIVARLLRAADLFDAVVAQVANPLTARARARAEVAGWSGQALQPEIAEALSEVAGHDDFWLGLYDGEITQGIIDEAPTSGVAASPALLRAFSEAVSEIIDIKSGHLAGRGQRVAAYARAIASTLGVNPLRVELIGLAALWNDIGTLGVPNRILAKPSLLSVEEMERMRGHPSFSGRILERVPVLDNAAVWVSGHHERIDGKGYPEMLSGSEIGSEAGILSLADAYVAMISPRPYRGPLPVEDARAIIDAGAGTQWDPFLVKVLLELVRHEAPESVATSAS